MRDWVVGGAILLADDGLLLVRTAAATARSTGSPPGGVIEVHDGESLLDGLTREVEEETGLRVTAWDGPLYEVDTEAPGLGWRLRVEVHLATACEGELRLDDPDGIVVDAAFVARRRCAGHLDGCHPWVREPLGAWLDERWDRRPGRSATASTAADLQSLVVTRLG